MKKWLTIVLFIPLLARAQRTYVDTIIANHCIRIDWDKTANTREGIFYMPGAGQVGNGTLSDTTFIKQFGYEMWILGGWNGQVSLGNGTHRPVQVSIIQTTTDNCCGYMRYFTMKTVLDSFRNTRFRALIKDSAWHAIGFSAGGWVWDMFNVAQGSAGDTAYYSYFKSMVDIEGVIPSDVGAPFTSFPPYPQRMGHRANTKRFKFLGFEQIGDGSRGIDAMAKNINDSAGAGNAFFAWSNYNGGGHTAFDSFTNPSVNNWTASNPNLVATNGTSSIFIANGQNVIQWQLRQGDTTLGNTPPTGSGGPRQVIQLPASSVTLAGTAAGTNGATITSATWSFYLNPSGGTITTPSSLTSTVTGFSTWGNNILRLIIVDNNGLKDTLYTTVKVDPACNPNPGRRLTIGLTQTTPTGEIFRPSTAQTSTGALGGDTIIIPRNNGRVYDLVRMGTISGDPCRPIVIMWDSAYLIRGKLVVDAHSQYLVYDGRGGRIVGGSGDAIDGLLFNHIEMKNLFVDSAVNGAGVLMKTVEDTSNLETLYPNYPMTALSFHNSRIQNTQGNAFYLGSTNPDGTDPGQPPGIPNRLDSVSVTFDTCINNGQTGISVSNARTGAVIANNYLHNIGFGTGNPGGPFAIGIEFGGNTNGDIYNNYVDSTGSNGIEIFGFGPVNVYGNTFNRCGINTTGSAQNTFIANDPLEMIESNAPLALNIHDNYFSNLYPGAGAQAAAIRAFNSNGTMAAMNIHNNTFCIPGANPVTWQSTYFIGSPSPTLASNVLGCPGGPVLRIGINLKRKLKAK